MLSRIFPSLFRRRSRVLVAPPSPFEGEIDARTRMEIRDWLALPTTQLVLGIMEGRHPGKNLPAMLPRNKWDALGATCYFNRVRGWELFRNTLLNITNPDAEQAPLEETFPDPEK